MDYNIMLLFNDLLMFWFFFKDHALLLVLTCFPFLLWDSFIFWMREGGSQFIGTHYVAKVSFELSAIFLLPTYMQIMKNQVVQCVFIIQSVWISSKSHTHNPNDECTFIAKIWQKFVFFVSWALQYLYRRTQRMINSVLIITTKLEKFLPIQFPFTQFLPSNRL